MHDDYEDARDCPEDYEGLWAFEQALQAEAADYRTFEGRLGDRQGPAAETDDSLPPW